MSTDRNVNIKRDWDQEEQTITPSDHFWFCRKCDDFHYDLRCDKEVGHVMDNDAKFRALQASIIRCNSYLERLGFSPINMPALPGRD